MENTLEYQNWGWNAITVSSIMTIVFTFVEGWGLYKQGRTIWQHRRGEAVSVVWLSCFCFVFVSVFIYGLAISSVALTVNGVLALLHIPILVGLWKFKGFARWEIVTTIALACTVIAMGFSSHKDWFFLAFLGLGSASIGMQPLEMWWKKSARDVDIRLITVYLLSTIFWVMYAYSIQDWVLRITTPLALTFLILAGLLWLKY